MAAVGNIVLYTLNADDVAAIDAAHPDAEPAVLGDVFPAVVVRWWTDNTLDLKVFLPVGDHYVTARPQSGHSEQGHWRLR